MPGTTEPVRDPVAKVKIQSAYSIDDQLLRDCMINVQAGVSPEDPMVFTVLNLHRLLQQVPDMYRLCLSHLTTDNSMAFRQAGLAAATPPLQYLSQQHPNVTHLQLYECYALTIGEDGSVQLCQVLSSNLSELAHLQHLHTLAASGFVLLTDDAFRTLAGLKNLKDMSIDSIDTDNAAGCQLLSVTSLTLRSPSQLPKDPMSQGRHLLPSLERLTFNCSDVEVLAYFADHPTIQYIKITGGLTSYYAITTEVQSLRSMASLKTLEVDLADVPDDDIDLLCDYLCCITSSGLKVVFSDSSYVASDSEEPRKASPVIAQAMRYLNHCQVASVEVDDSCSGPFDIADIAELMLKCRHMLRKISRLPITPAVRQLAEEVLPAQQAGSMSDQEALEGLLAYLEQREFIAPDYCLYDGTIWQLLAAASVKKMEVRALALETITPMACLRDLKVSGRLSLVCLPPEASRSVDSLFHGIAASKANQLGSFRVLLPNLEILRCCWLDDRALSGQLGSCLTGHVELRELYISGSFTGIAHGQVPWGLQCLAGLTSLRNLHVTITDGGSGLPSRAMVYAITASPALWHVSFARAGEPAASHSQPSSISAREFASLFGSRACRRVLRCKHISSITLDPSCGCLPSGVDLAVLRERLGGKVKGLPASA